MRRLAKTARRFGTAGLALAAAGSTSVAPASAEDAPPAGDAAPALSQPLGAWHELDAWLKTRGVTVGVAVTADLLANVSGGEKRGATGEALGELEVDFDLGRIVGWKGATVHASGYWLVGEGLSSCCVDNLLTISNIEASSGVRLNEVYLEQTFAQDAISIRIGQIAADTEFWLSDTAGAFINSTFGWPGINGVDLPGGGPAYPVPTPGVRMRWTTGGFTLLGALYNGDPTAGPDDDRYGLAFDLDDGVFAIVEAAYAHQPKNGLSGTFKVGAWYNSNDFDNLVLAANGEPLSTRRPGQLPRQERGDLSFYAIVDHELYREAGKDGEGLSGFARIAVNPQQDRNPVWLYFDTGLAYTGLLPGRESDIFGIAFAYAGMSPDLARADRYANRVSGTDGAVADFEAVIEVTYQAAITSDFTLQPFGQIVIHPGGSSGGAGTDAALRNAVVFGLRSAIRF